MATEEDNFDIDIYGDGGEEYRQGEPEAIIKAADILDPTNPRTEATSNIRNDSTASGQAMDPEVKHDNGQNGSDVAQKIASTGDSASDPVQLPKHAPQTQGLKRKDGADDRFVDPGATSALFVSELHWWVNDDDIRGWANQSQCEDELEEITFSEHKVNGKSKGQAYVTFKSPQAATAAKQKIESFGEGQQYTKKFTVSYTNPYTNPFRTLPKDGPMRNSGPANNNRSTPNAYGGAGSINGIPQPNMGFNNSSGGYRGNRGGGYTSRGGGMNNMTGYNRGGFQQPMPGGFQGSSMGGFQSSAIGGMQSYGGFQNRGGMAGGMRGGPMGMRGGRGGMNPNGMMGMPMNGMGMGAMAGQIGGMGMNMPQMGGGMGMQGMQHSYDHSHVNSAGRHGSSANPAATPASSTPQSRQYSPSGSAGSSSPMMRGVCGSGRKSISGATWASYTQYSPPPAGSPLTHFPSQVGAPCTTIIPSPQNTTLKRKSSFTGNQAHFNPAFFPPQRQGQQSNSGGDANWNPHGAKRTRQE